MKRRVLSCLTALLLISTVQVASPAWAEPLERLAVLSINLRGVMDVPCDKAEANWKVRFANIGKGLKAQGAVPDIIALQEVNAWTWCFFSSGFIKDYATLEELLSSLESNTGVKYRIAYLNPLTKTFGNFHCTTEGQSQWMCEAMSGLALLYNPGRIRNLMTTTSPEVAAQAAPHDSSHRPEAHLRRSLPICNPPDGSTVSSRIDGPAQRDKCGRDTPAGLAWVANSGIALARLELRERPGASFDVYNVHLAYKPDEHSKDINVANNAITQLESKFGSSRWIPPIILGDFNVKTKEVVLAEFSRFDFRGSADINDYILSGKSRIFRAWGKISDHNTWVMPNIPDCHDAQFVWSDHCGVLTVLNVETDNTPRPNSVSCTVFDDGYSNRSAPSDAIYFADNAAACTPDGTARGNCHKWFGQCKTGESNPRSVNFKAFNDGDSNQTARIDAVYNNAPNVSCIPDGTPTGNCRRWFGLAETTDGQKAQCFLFDDGYTNMIGPTNAIYYRSPRTVCMPDGSATDACRKWFGRCELQARTPEPRPRPRPGQCSSGHKCCEPSDDGTACNLCRPENQLC